MWQHRSEKRAPHAACWYGRQIGDADGDDDAWHTVGLLWFSEEYVGDVCAGVPARWVCFRAGVAGGSVATVIPRHASAFSRRRDSRRGGG